MSRNLKRFIIFTVLIAVVTVCWAQRRAGRGYYRNEPRDARGGVPEWTNEAGFEKDVFAFVRVIYNSSGRSRGYYGGFYGYGGRGRWTTDAPDADLNLSFRLQQMTSMKVHPNETNIELTDPTLFHYPFIYIVEPGSLQFSEEEVTALRKYLLNGGFLMVDDFWGDDEWDNFYGEMKRVFPDRDYVELPMDHPIFHAIFSLKMTKNELQIPNVGTGTASERTGVTWEDNHYGNTRDVHFRSYFDDKGRMVAIICHNTDNGDGWEREGDNEYYFREFSEKKAYPLMINIVFYAMTH